MNKKTLLKCQQCQKYDTFRDEDGNDWDELPILRQTFQVDDRVFKFCYCRACCIELLKELLEQAERTPLNSIKQNLIDMGL